MREQNKIELKSIGELTEGIKKREKNKGEQFFVPSYQRGYRWGTAEVKALLEDILNFSKTKDSKEIYCIQPLVVKKKGGYWHVIDGQQRLTTIYLMHKYFDKDDEEPTYTIDYETRAVDGNDTQLSRVRDLYKEIQNKYKNEDEAGSLITKDIEKASNIDLFHMLNAYKTIVDFFDGETRMKKSFQAALYDDVQFIWYEVNEEGDPYDVFTRLNSGKTPLTNADLIKGWFLVRDKKARNKQQYESLKSELSYDWVHMESRLQDDKFWYFLTSSVDKDSSSRMELLFDLMAGKKAGDSNFHSFHFFKEKEGENDKLTIWRKVREYFQTLEDLYEDRHSFHYVGFLLSMDADKEDPLKTLRSIVEDSGIKNKEDFYRSLRTKMIKKVGLKKKGISLVFNEADKDKVEDLLAEVSYPNGTIRPILLLFNIFTLLQAGDSGLRFAFNHYKQKNWDVEHIYPQTPLDIFDGTKVKKKLLGLLYAFFKEDNDDAYAEQQKDKLLKGLKDVESYKKEIITDESLRKLITDRLNLDAQVEDDGLGNLCLLGQGTNRGIKNIPFPIKRMKIIENDKVGEFIPIATKNVFLKFYSQENMKLLTWSNKDKENYYNAMLDTLVKGFSDDNFFPNK